MKSTMKKFIKITAIVIITLALILFVFSFGVSRFINTDSAKKEISQRVYSYTGRELTLNGDMKWSFFPWIGLTLTDASLSNPAGYPSTPFISVQKASLHVRLIPLLSGRFELRELILINPEIHLIHREKSNNWQVFADKSTAEATATTSAHATNNSSSTDNTLKFDISEVNVENANVSYVDEANNNSYTFKHVNLTANDIALNQSFPINLAFELESQSPALKGNVSFDSDVTLNPAAKKYQFQNIQFQTNLNNPKQSNFKLQTQLAGNFNLDLAKQTADLHLSKAQINNLSFTANAAGTQITDAPSFTGKINIAPFNPRALLNSFGQLPPDTANPFILTKAEGTIGFKTVPGLITIDPLNFSIDDSHVKGNVTVNTASTVPQIKFALNLDQVDLNRYIGNDQATPAAQKPAPKPAVSTSTSSSSSANYAANGVITIGQLKVKKVQVSQISATIAATPQKISVSPFSANAYQGKIQGAFTLDQSTKTPKISLNTNVQSLQVQPLLRDLADTGVLTGTLNLNANITTQGQSSQAMMQSLNGQAKVNLSNGVLTGFSLLNQLQSANALIVKQANGLLGGQPVKPAATNNSSGQTVINNFSGTFQITNGVVQNNDLSLKSSTANVTGQGQINLPQQQWHYNLNATLLPGTNTPGLANIQNLLGGSIPLIAQGTFDKFIILPDMNQIGQALLKNQARQLLNNPRLQQAAERVVGQAAQQGTEQVGQAAQGLLQGLSAVTGG